MRLERAITQPGQFDVAGLRARYLGQLVPGTPSPSSRSSGGAQARGHTLIKFALVANE